MAIASIGLAIVFIIVAFKQRTEIEETKSELNKSNSLIKVKEEVIASRCDQVAGLSLRLIREKKELYNSVFYDKQNNAIVVMDNLEKIGVLGE